MVSAGNMLSSVPGSRIEQASRPCLQGADTLVPSPPSGTGDLEMGSEAVVGRFGELGTVL